MHLWRGVAAPEVEERDSRLVLSFLYLCLAHDTVKNCYKIKEANFTYTDSSQYLIKKGNIKKKKMCSNTVQYVIPRCALQGVQMQTTQLYL